jgi:hypothetical protein
MRRTWRTRSPDVPRPPVSLRSGYGSGPEAGDANRRYVGAAPYVKRLLSAQVLKRVEIKGGELVSVELKPPFHGLFLLAGSNRGSWSGRGDTI